MDMHDDKMYDIKRRLGMIEYETVIGTGLNAISGAFVIADMKAFDLERNEIYIEISYGVEGDWKEVEDRTLHYDTLENVK